MTTSKIIIGDMREQLKSLADNSIDSIVTDPPYEISFMNKSWDSAGVAYDQATWRECLRVLKPGGHMLSFGACRTFHRIACAIEDSGFEIRDTICYLFGTGFPKSKNVGGGWGSALKPAYEPVIMARKPLTSTLEKNVLEHGTGAINVDGCRIGAAGGTKRSHQADYDKNADGSEDRSQHWARTGHSVLSIEGLGRWPANVILDEEAAAALDEMSGERRPGERPARRGGTMGFGGDAAMTTSHGRIVLDSGGASRFFYTAKASTSEREAGLDHLPKKTGAEITEREPESEGLDNPRAGAGRKSTGRANIHPTIKPISLMRYLVRLVTPVGGTVLDPFTGSGSTGVAAGLEGFNFIGCEMSDEYATIAKARIAHWCPEAKEPAAVKKVSFADWKKGVR